MACGATLKRTMDFDPLLNPTAPKRRRCIPVSPPSSAPRKYLRMEPSPFGNSSSNLSAGNGDPRIGLHWFAAWNVRVPNQHVVSLYTKPQIIVEYCDDVVWLLCYHLSPAKGPLSVLLPVISLEHIFNSIKQEYKRIQKRKHLDGSYHQSEGCYSLESPAQSSSIIGWCCRTQSWQVILMHPPEVTTQHFFSVRFVFDFLLRNLLWRSFSHQERTAIIHPQTSWDDLWTAAEGKGREGPRGVRGDHDLQTGRLVYFTWR